MYIAFIFSMRHILILFISFLYLSTTDAQENLRLDYDMVLDFGNLSSSKQYKFPSYLIFNDSSSLFRYKIAEKVSEDINAKVMKEHYFLDALDGNMIVDVVELDSLGFQVLYDRQLDSIISREIIDQEVFILSAQLIGHQWEFLDEKEVVNNIICSKALKYHKGRTYTAWFDPTSPYRLGPWKFVDLPGLVIKIESIDKSITFQLKDTVPRQTNELVEIDKSGRHVSFEELWNYYLKKRKAEFEFDKNTIIKEMVKANLDPRYFQFPIYHNTFELLTTDISQLEKWAELD